jgi:hypothetical protein
VARRILTTARLSPVGTAQFGLAVGLAAIFVDASIAHGLFWGERPLGWLVLIAFVALFGWLAGAAPSAPLFLPTR